MTLTVADTAYSIAVVRAEEKELFSDPYAHLFAEAGAHAEDDTRRLRACRSISRPRISRRSSTYAPAQFGFRKA